MSNNDGASVCFNSITIIIIIIIIIPSFYIAPFKTPKVALHNICVSVCEYVGVCLWTLEAKSLQKEMGFKVLFKDGQ